MLTSYYTHSVSFNWPTFPQDTEG